MHFVARHFLYSKTLSHFLDLLISNIFHGENAFCRKTASQDGVVGGVEVGVAAGLDLGGLASRLALLAGGALALLAGLDVDALGADAAVGWLLSAPLSALRCFFLCSCSFSSFGKCILSQDTFYIQKHLALS